MIRRIIGYDRFSTQAAFAALNDIYRLLRLFMNFFQPVQKLVSKRRHGARIYKVYDMAKTPYQRLLTSGILTQEKMHQLAATYNGLNPVTLRQQIIQNVEHLWTLSDQLGKSQCNDSVR